MTDVNGDRRTTAADALWVINQLRKDALAKTTPVAAVALADAVADDDDEDDLLTLLARDVAELN